MTLRVRSKDELDPAVLVPYVFEWSKLVRPLRSELAILDLPEKTEQFLLHVGLPPHECTRIVLRLLDTQPLRDVVGDALAASAQLEDAMCIGSIGMAALAMKRDYSLYLVDPDYEGKSCLRGNYVSASLEAYAAQVALYEDLRKYTRPAGSFNQYFESRPFTGELVGTPLDEIASVFKKELLLIDPKALSGEYCGWSRIVEDIELMGCLP